MDSERKGVCLSKETKASESTKVTITKVFDFAGEEVWYATELSSELSNWICKISATHSNAIVVSEKIKSSMMAVAGLLARHFLQVLCMVIYPRNMLNWTELSWLIFITSNLQLWASRTWLGLIRDNNFTQYDTSITLIHLLLAFHTELSILIFCFSISGWIKKYQQTPEKLRVTWRARTVNKRKMKVKRRTYYQVNHLFLAPGKHKTHTPNNVYRLGFINYLRIS